MDFGDQIHRALDLLRRHPAVLARLRARYRYVLVDEFQDTNKAQLELLRLVAGDVSANLTVVGDDDQAIYRWRGAAAANLLAFRELYPGAREVVLVENHRSTQPILDAAARLISYNNPHRLEAIAGIDKRLRAQRPGGLPVRHLHYDTVSAEADGVAALVEQRLQAGFRPRDIAVLVRSNGDADPFLRALNVKGIPHRFSGSRGLYAREEVRLLVHFLRVLASPEDSVSLFYLAASEVYRVPEADLIRLNRYGRRKSRPLMEVMRGLPDNEDLASVTGAARESVARLLADLDRAVAEVPHRRTGEVLYGFLQWSGVLADLAREQSRGAEARVRNIARFFETVKAYGEVATHDRVPAFVSHLDLLREAGDDPAVAEVDVDEDAVHVLTVHKAKGLEFPVVFLVGAAEDRFPLRRRGEGLALPEAVTADEDATGGHHREERRLFYVAMTRAKDELVLTSAADYGSGRPRKVSRFVVEALDLPSPAPVPRKSRATEALLRHQPAPEPLPGPEAPWPESEVLQLSYRQVDDYETCPLKYRYVHVLRVPLLTHHGLVYGHAVHEAVRQMFEARLAGRAFSADELVTAFHGAWVSEGFLSRTHEEQRLRAGEAALRRFHEDEAKAPWSPAAVEQDFAFYVGRNRVVGRYDLVLDEGGRVTIVDFKTGDVQTEEKAATRAKESLQLDVYALAWLRTKGRLPDRVELRFLESGLAAGRRPTREDVEGAEARIAASRGGHPPAGLRGASDLRGLWPVPVPRHLPLHREHARSRGLTRRTGMGLETPCEAFYGGRKVKVVAHLEPAELRLRGGVKLVLPISQIQTAEARRGVLHVEWPDGHDRPAPRPRRGAMGPRDPLSAEPARQARDQAGDARRRGGPRRRRLPGRAARAYGRRDDRPCRRRRPTRSSWASPSARTCRSSSPCGPPSRRTA